MVEKFKEILTKIIEKKGRVTLFAILKMDDLTDKWSVVLCAPWATEDTLKENFNYLRSLILDTFNEEERATIARMIIYQKNKHIVEQLLQYKQDAVISEAVSLNGNLIHQAYILASNPDL